MAVATVRQPIVWSLDAGNPLIRPGQLHGPLDARRASAAHVIRIGDMYRMYYWGTGDDGCHRICMAEASIHTPNAWQPLGSVLEPQLATEYNCIGPSFPHVVPSEDSATWLMYFCGWGKTTTGKRLPNTTGLAISEDTGKTWRYWSDKPVLACDRPWDQEGTGSVCVLREDGLLRMYYTAIGSYFPKPEGVQTGHGDIIPSIGIGYAVSRDGITWEKPLDGLVVSPRGFEADPYEYIASKPFIIREEGGYRLWVHTFGPAYRVRSLVSTDGLAWTWTHSGPDGDLGIGDSGAFDDHLRCYACVVRAGDEYRCWYTGNHFGDTGMGYAIGHRDRQRVE